MLTKTAEAGHYSLHWRLNSGTYAITYFRKFLEFSICVSHTRSVSVRYGHSSDTRNTVCFKLVINIKN